MKPARKPYARKRTFVSHADAVALHAEANKSDPFAAARMSLTLRSRQDDAQEVAKEARRILDARQAKINEDFKVWKAAQQPQTLGDIFFAAMNAPLVNDGPYNGVMAA